MDLERTIVPLQTEAIFTRFLALKDALDPGNLLGLGYPFVPVGADPAVAAPFRILFIGQALRAEPADERGPARTYAGSVSWAKSVFVDQLASRTSPFWRFCSDIVGRVAAEIIGQHVGEDSYRELTGWSNLLKIAGPFGNPSTALVKAQSHLCIDSLKTELAVFRPDAVVITTADFGSDEVLLKVFGPSESWSPDPANPVRTLVRDQPDASYIALWTDHPRNMGEAGNLEKTRRFCTEQIVAKLRSRR